MERTKNENENENNLPKLQPFSVNEYLKVRWKEETIDLNSYNNWAVIERNKLIKYELMLEHYLMHNIWVDISNSSRPLINIFDCFSYSGNQERWIKKIIRKMELHNNKNKNMNSSEAKTIGFYINKMNILTFGQKIIVWNCLQKGIFKNKFFGLKKELKKELIVAWNNLRVIRNGIAHINSKNQIYNKLKVFDPSEKLNKEELYNKTFHIVDNIKLTIEKEIK